MNAVLAIEVGFDFICPWCLIGLRNLHSALAQLRTERPEVAVQLHWRGVQLLPDVPATGWPFEKFYLQRLGSEAAMRQRQQQVLQAASAAGAHIDYRAIAVMPNTADAHRMLALASRHGNTARRDALLERLLRAYFEDGDDLGDPALLLAHGEAAGFDRAALQLELRGADRPYRDEGAAAGGVPYYRFNGKLSVRGAQPAAALLEAMRAALAGAGAPA